MNFVFLGPPGSGKGTQAMKVAQELNLTHLSTGDVLREAVKNQTEVGLTAKAYMDKGDLVPDEVLIGMIKDKVTGGELSDGFILDGFPRTIPQATSLKEMLKEAEANLDKAILLDVDDEEIVRRLSGRWFCPECSEGYNYPVKMPEKAGFCDKDGAELKRRPDDEESVVRNRLEVYEKLTEPIIGFYAKESILTSVKGVGSPDSVFNAILEAVK
ncbi:MAG: adenylate kinase [bacterium]|nr:adenylate kinase [bacterium]